MIYEPLWTLGNWAVTRFSVAALLAAALGCLCLVWLCKRRHVAQKAVDMLLPLCLFLGVFLGHLLYGLMRLLIDGYSYEQPLLFLLNPGAGGTAFLGALGGVSLACLLVGRRRIVCVDINKRFLSVDELMRYAVPALLLTLAVIRFAEPLDGQGKGPDMLAEFFPLSFAPEADFPDDRYLPAFFYEGIYALALAVWGMMAACGRAKERKASFFVILYLAGQMFFEMLRQDSYVHDTSMITFVRLNQLLAVIILAGLMAYYTVLGRKRAAPAYFVRQWALYAVCVGACVGLEFLFDKPLPLFGENIYFEDWLVYLLIGLTAVGTGAAALNVMKKAVPDAR